MHQSSTPSTPTNTGAARMMTSTYRSWICWPWTVAPCLAQPVSNVPARAASPTRETLEAAIRIGRSGDRELEGHADGGVHRPLTTADLALLEAGQGVGARRQREHPGMGRAGVHVGDLAEAEEILLGLVALLLGVGDDVVLGLAGEQREQHDLVGDRGRLPLRLALAAPSQRQRHHRDQKHAEPPGTWPPPVLAWLPAHRDLLAAGPPLSWYGYARRHARHREGT